MGARISARNVFQAEVSQIKRWPVDVEVTLKIADNHQIMAIVTNEAADDLDWSRAASCWLWSNPPSSNFLRRSTRRTAGIIVSTAR